MPRHDIIDIHTWVHNIKYACMYEDNLFFFNVKDGNYEQPFGTSIFGEYIHPMEWENATWYQDVDSHYVNEYIQ